jgi:hypothetical protein
MQLNLVFLKPQSICSRAKTFRGQTVLWNRRSPKYYGGPSLGSERAAGELIN